MGRELWFGRGRSPYTENRSWIGKMRFYNRQQRERLGTEAGLEAYANHYLLSGILLTIFSTPTEQS